MDDFVKIEKSLFLKEIHGTLYTTYVYYYNKHVPKEVEENILNRRFYGFVVLSLFGIFVLSALFLL